MRVADLMTRIAVSCTESCTAETAARLLATVEYGVVPVLNHGQVVGVITERSICVTVVALRCDLATISAGECLDPAPAVCHPEDDASAVLAKFAQSHARSAIVVDKNNELQGMLLLSVLALRVSTAARELYAALKKVEEGSACVSTLARSRCISGGEYAPMTSTAHLKGKNG